MNRYVCAAAIASVVAGSAMCAHAAAPAPPSGPAQMTLPPDPVLPVANPPEDQPIPCDLRASPDYVPGIDARGREVVPAEIPSGPEVEINTEVFVEMRSKNRQLRDTGVIVNLPGLGAPACVPLEEKLRR